MWLQDKAVLKVCVLHRTGVGFSATGSRSGAEAGMDRIQSGNRLEVEIPRAQSEPHVLTTT